MTKDFDGAVLVISDPTSADEVAARVASGWYPDSPYHFTVSESTPTSLPEGLQSRINALQKNSAEGSVVLTVYPRAATSNTLHERPTNGQIPS
jgi:hypothetical protein